jgi:hypothetical protein
MSYIYCRRRKGADAFLGLTLLKTLGRGGNCTNLSEKACGESSCAPIFYPTTGS